jgi:hypothetical protein
MTDVLSIQPERFCANAESSFRGLAVNNRTRIMN